MAVTDVAVGVAMVSSAPGVVGIGYKSHALTGSSSLDAAPVTGSLLFYAPVCRLAVCCATGFSLWCYSAVVTVFGLLCSDCFSGELVWIV